MHDTTLMGAAAPELDWVPSPTYVLRRAAILDWLRGYPPGKVLEIGCGPGALLRDLSKLGFHGTGIEISERSRAVAGTILSDTPAVNVRERLPEQGKESYDYLLCFEVLEHIEDDTAALRDWLNYLKPGGVVFISIPAHKSRWNITDIFAGHYRRYDEADALALIASAGLTPVRTGTYGWPASRIFEFLRLRAKKKELRQAGIDPGSVGIGDTDLTKSSGVDRKRVTKLYRLYGSLAGRIILSSATRIQKLFYATSLGISFISISRKPGEST